MSAILHGLFGAKGQVAIGVLCLLVALAAWAYGSTLHGKELLAFIFHISMFALVVACYAIIATGLGYRATERVEAHVEAAVDVDVQK